MDIWYVTREDVMSSLDFSSTSKIASVVDSQIGPASRSAEEFLHRYFYPERRSVAFDWPSLNYPIPWELWLGDNELISVESVTAGGVNLDVDDLILRRYDNRNTPPYSTLEVNRASSTVFQSGQTTQRAINILGVFGFNDTDVSYVDAQIGAVSSSDNVITLSPRNGIFNVGVGSLLLCGTERMVIQDRMMADTSIKTASELSDRESSQIVTVDVGQGDTFARGEIILMGAERMRVDTIAGDDLIVTRAFDGSVLQDHMMNSLIFAERSFVVNRGALGSVAAAHDSGDLVHTHRFPPMLRDLVKAEAINGIEQIASGYARTVGSGSFAKEATGAGLDDVRERAYAALGRTQRSMAV